MKLKFITLLLAAVTMGWSYNANAQTDSTKSESGDFWNENAKAEGGSADSKQSDSREGATATVKPVDNSCSNRDELREEVRLLIRPFRYNLAKTTTINFKRYPQKMKVLIPIYSKQEHRIIFSTKGLPQEVGIKVYDKPASEKKRKLLYESTGGEPIHTFELPEEYKESYLHVEYDVPASEAEDRSTTRRGCVIMMMGYLYLPEGGESEETVTTEE